MGSIGFTDLTEDEALLVSMYRDWTDQRSDSDGVERELTRALSRDFIFPALAFIFSVFRKVSQEELAICGRGDVLSLQEECLLETFSQSSRFPVGAVRSVGAITRSGRDEMTRKINNASWEVALLHESSL